MNERSLCIHLFEVLDSSPESELNVHLIRQHHGRVSCAIEETKIFTFTFEVRWSSTYSCENWSWRPIEKSIWILFHNVGWDTRRIELTNCSLDHDIISNVVPFSLQSLFRGRSQHVWGVKQWRWELFNGLSSFVIDFIRLSVCYWRCHAAYMMINHCSGLDFR